MDDQAQAEGEKRVRDQLIDPLLEMGLAKPSTLTKDAFGKMLRRMEQTFARLSDDDLKVLRDRAERTPGGKDRDRFPLLLRFQEWARDFNSAAQDNDPSPFIGRVMASPAGDAALSGGYAPEFLEQVRADHKRSPGTWPGRWTITKVREKADDARRRFDDLQMRTQRGDALTQEERAFLEARAAKIEKCRQFAQIGKGRSQKLGQCAK